MVCFSNDADILKYEPALFGELHLPWQVVAAGTGGEISATTFTDDDADFVSAQVQAGGVIYLRSADGLLDGAYEIVSVDSTTQLTISVIRPDSDSPSIAPPAASEITYRVSTFAPQTAEVGFQLTEYFGIKPGNPAGNYAVEDVLDTNVLKRASVFAVIASVYRLVASKDKDENFWNKSTHYQALFEKARERCRLSIDVGQDGIADLTKNGASIKLVRD